MQLIPDDHGDDASHGRPAATTQDIKVVRIIADRMVVMRSGKIIGLGPSNDVFCPPNQPHNGARLASVPDRALG
jgi:ABC-type glutathione transport system ATPase component